MPARRNTFIWFLGEEVPPEVVALKCSHCGWWWYPANNLAKFKRAYEAKNSYLKWWRKKSDFTVMALPVLLVMVLAVTLGITVGNITRQQIVGTKASAGAIEFKASYLGGRREEIRFKLNKELRMVMVKKLQDEMWGPVEVDVIGDGWYGATINNIDESSVYQIQVAGVRYYFKAK